MPSDTSPDEVFNLDSRSDRHRNSSADTLPLIVDPKPWASQGSTPNDWFKFYAGFNHEFVHGILGATSHLRKVVDPWNGSGATTTAAAVAGMACRGFDLNPAMVVVARSRLASVDTVSSAAANLSRLQQSDIEAVDVHQDDPLLQWFVPASVRAVRALEKIVRASEANSRTKLGVSSLDSTVLSPLGCVYYVALFQTVRKLVRSFRSTNPTWLQIPDAKARLRPSTAQIAEEYTAALFDMAAASRIGPTLNEAASSTVEWASSVAIPLADDSVDLIVTSPPYCTRLDYAVATATDLAVLGIGGEKFKQLRRALLGTTTVPSSVSTPLAAWGNICRRLLSEVGAHRSKASKTYYTKSLHQYFDGLYRSIAEMARVMRPGGHCYLIVQDSYYKEVHVDLPNIVAEMALQTGFAFCASWDFFHSQTYSGMNPYTENYRSRRLDPRESVLLFERRADR